jgi:ATP-dependent RNA helicase A
MLLLSEIRAAETGSNKQTASKSTALSLVRQLFHLGVIEAFSGSLKRTKESDTIRPFETSVGPDTMQNVRSLLGNFGIIPKVLILNKLKLVYFV